MSTLTQYASLSIKKLWTTMAYVVLMLLISSTISYGTTYYVSPQGNDANSCSAATSPSTRKQTVTGGTACLHDGAGDTLVIGDGTYSECLIDRIPGGASATQPTTVKAEHYRQATLKGALCYTGIIQIGQRGSPTDSGVVRNYITLDGLVLDISLDCPCAGVQTMGGIEDGSVSGAHDLQFLNLEIHGGKNSGDVSQCTSALGQSGNCYGWTFRGNWLHDLGMAPLGSGTSAFSYGIYPSGSDNLFENNEFGPNISGYGIHGNSPGDHVHRNIIRNNYFHDLLSPSMILCGSDNQIYNNIEACYWGIASLKGDGRGAAGPPARAAAVGRLCLGRARVCQRPPAHPGTARLCPLRVPTADHATATGGEAVRTLVPRSGNCTSSATRRNLLL